MGNRFVFTAVHEEEEKARAAIDAGIREVQRIEDLLTTFNEDSQTAAINRAAGIAAVQVDEEVFRLIQRAQKISSITQGAFDLSYGSIDRRFWNFDTNMKELPDAETARRSVRLINYRNIVLDENHCTVFLKERGMRIGFGGIGKGYAADRARMALEAAGISSGVVNAAGDLTAWGRQPGGRPWTVGIADPLRSDAIFSSLEISGQAVATSGDYEKFALINGRRYAHTIDPKTGFPVSGIRSVTIIGPSAELCDALTTPVMVMGVNVGLALIDQLQGIGCIIVDDAGCIHTSKQIKSKT